MRSPSRALLSLLVATAMAVGQVAVASDSVLPVLPGVGDVAVVVPPLTTETSLSADEERFVSLWTSRFTGPGMQQYVDSDVEYDDGYNDRSEEEKRRLVDLLVAHWRRVFPGAAEQLDANDADPSAMGNDVLRGVVYELIFRKNAFKASLRMPAEQQKGAVEPDQPGVPAEAAPAVRTAEEEAARAADRVARILATLRAAVPVVDRPDTYQPVWVNPPAVAPEALADVDRTLDAISEATVTSSALLDKITALSVPAVRGARRLGPLDGVPLTYVACFQKPGAAESCGLPTPVSMYDDTLVPLQVGVPATYDADGDLMPDVQLEVAVDLVGALGSASVRVDVKRLTAAGNVRATGRYALPNQSGTVTAGFDGPR